MHFPLPETSLFDIAEDVLTGSEKQVGSGMVPTKVSV